MSEIADDPVEESEIRDLYDSCIKFRLVSNFKAVMKPLSTVTEETFDGYDYVEIIEPIGWDGVHLETQRDMENHGFTAQVGIDEINFRCNTGQEFLEAAEFVGGSDTDVKLVVTENDKLVAVIQLNFETYSKDVDGVHLTVEEAPFDGLFATRKDTKYPFELDKKLLLYSPARFKVTSWGYFKEALQWYEGRRDPDFETRDSRMYFNILSNRENSEVETAYQYPQSITTDLNDYENNNPQAIVFKRGGRVKITVELGVVAYFRDRTPYGGHEGTDQISVGLKTQLYSIRGDGTPGSSREGKVVYPIDEDTYPEYQYWISHYDTIGKGPVEEQEPGEVDALVSVFKKSWDVTVYANDVLSIKLYTEHVFEDIHQFLPNQNVAVYVVKEFVDKETNTFHRLGTPETDSMVEVAGFFIGPATTADSVTLKKLTETITTQMLEQEDNPVVSEIGEDEIIHLIPGHAVRKAEEGKEYTASFNDIISGAKPLLGLGYNIEVGDDRERLRIDYAGQFYRKDRAVGLIHDLENLHSYEENADIRRTYNEVETGYSKFSKNRETNKRQTAFDAHGRHEYLTPIRKTLNKKELVSSFVASPYEMDNVRIKQFDIDSKESISSDDDNLFMVTATQGAISEIVVTHIRWARALGKKIEGDPRRGARELGNINGFLVRYEGILPLAVGDTLWMTPMGWGSRTIVREVRDINYQPVDLEGSQYDTLVMFDELTDDEEFMAQDNVALMLDFEPRIIPESLEPFSLVEGTQSRDTSYNLRYTPRRILLNNHAEINVGLVKKQDGELITVQKIEGNGTVVTQYNDESQFIGGDVNRDRVAENGNEILESFGNRDRLHQPYTIHAKYNNVSYEFYTRVLLGHKTNMESSYGLIEIRTPFGELVRGFLEACKFYPGERTMELTLLLHDRRPYVEQEYLATIDGTFILTTKGEFIIVQT